MATSFTIMWSLWLLILVQACWGDQASLSHRDVAMVTALKQVGQAMQCFGETTQEGLSLQKQNNDQVTTIAKDVLDLKNQLAMKDQKVDKISQILVDMNNHICNKQTGASCDQETMTLKALLDSKEQKVIALTREITELKTQLGNNGRKVNNCSQATTELKLLLDGKDKNVTALAEENANLKIQLGTTDQKVQELDTKLGESQRQVHQLEQEVKDLNNKVDAQKPICLTRECKKLPSLEKIKQMVANYINHKNWDRLKRELGLLLDHMGEEYKFLQYVDAHYSISNYGHTQRLEVGSLWHIGTNGYTYFVSFLVCAGLPVDAMDSYRMTMLHGAARGGQLDLVKMLVDRGAVLDLKDRYGQSPLIWAAQGGHLDVARWLVQAGADTTIKDNARHNALYWARSLNHLPLAEYLEKLPQ